MIAFYYSLAPRERACLTKGGTLVAAVVGGGQAEAWATVFRRRRNEGGLCARGTLGTICFIACASRPSPLIARCPLGLGPLLPPLLPLPPRSPSRVWGRGPWRSTTRTLAIINSELCIRVMNGMRTCHEWYAYVSCAARWSGPHAILPP